MIKSLIFILFCFLIGCKSTPNKAQLTALYKIEEFQKKDKALQQHLLNETIYKLDSIRVDSAIHVDAFSLFSLLDSCKSFNNYTLMLISQLDEPDNELHLKNDVVKFCKYSDSFYNDQMPQFISLLNTNDTARLEKSQIIMLPSLSRFEYYEMNFEFDSQKIKIKYKMKSI